jgi:hypothetical protein
VAELHKVELLTAEGTKESEPNQMRLQWVLGAHSAQMRGKRARERAEAAADDVSGFAADADINLRGSELDGAADLAVLGEVSGFELSHIDLSSPAQPWAPPVV